MLIIRLYIYHETTKHRTTIKSSGPKSFHQTSNEISRSSHLNHFLDKLIKGGGCTKLCLFGRSTQKVMSTYCPHLPDRPFPPLFRRD